MRNIIYDSSNYSAFYRFALPVCSALPAIAVEPICVVVWSDGVKRNSGIKPRIPLRFVPGRIPCVRPG